MAGEARQDDRDDCLERFDDFQKCVLVGTRRHVYSTCTVFREMEVDVPGVGE